MPAIGGVWSNYYGSVIDVVVTVTGQGDGSLYDLDMQIQLPPNYNTEVVDTQSGTASVGETNYHVFSIELPEYDQEDDYIFTAILNGGVNEDGDAVAINPTLPSTEPNFSDVLLTSEPVDGLPNELGTGETGSVAVQLLRQEYDTSQADVSMSPITLSGKIRWTADGTEIGETDYKFTPDWENTSPTTVTPNHPTDIVITSDIEAPDNIGDYEFCVSVETVEYYVPSSSEWHQTIMSPQV